MANISIATLYHRINNSNKFLEDVKNIANSYYAFIGKSDVWSDTLNSTTDNLPVPVDNPLELKKSYANMIALKKLTGGDVYKVIPRYEWTSNETYDEWDDLDSMIFGGYTQTGNTVTEVLAKKFYVHTDELKIYKCIKRGEGTSLVKPTQINTTPTTESDGYTWQYMYTLTALEAFNFLFDKWIPVKTITTTVGASAEELTRFTRQNDAKTATNGKIFNIKVTSGGSGYTSSPTVTITGDGSGAVATATISSGTVTGINISNNGSNYKNVLITLSGGGGTGATARAVLSPKNGHGVDSELELGAFYIILIPKFEYEDGSGDFIVNQDFRQVGIIKNPYNYGTTTVSTSTTMRSLKILNLNTHSGFVNDGTIEGGTSGAKAYIDFYDSTNNRIWYHQNSKTGYGTFIINETITGKNNTGGNAGSGTTASSSVITPPENEPYSGDILILTNTTPILRSSSQVELCPMIIDF